MTADRGVTDQMLTVASGRVTASEIWRLSHGHRARLCALMVLGIASTATGLTGPVVVGILIDRVQEHTADLADVLLLTSAMAVTSIVGAAGIAVTTVLVARIYHAILAELRGQLVGRAFALPQHRVERAGTGDLISRTSDDVTAVADAASVVIQVLTVTLFTIIVSLVGLVVLEWPYIAAFLVALPVYAVGMRWYLRTGPTVYRDERAAMSQRAQQIVESQRGYDTVIGFGLGAHRDRTVIHASWEVSIQTLRARTVLSMFNARLNFAECLSLATVLITGFVLIRQGSSTVGAATTAMLLMLRLIGPINELLMVFDTIASAGASLNRMVGVTMIPIDGTDMSESSTRRHPVRLRDVAFRYGTGPRALEEITLDIAAAEHVAVVGASGAGKSTLAAVIAGIHPPELGTVTRPRQTAVITQEVHVFAGTLRDNLTLVAPEADDAQLHGALEATGAGSLLEVLHDGLDTIVGSGGRPLTDAQAQQIALARLVLLDPELAILDEATAEAGSTYADVVDQGTRAALRGRAGLVIAHRLSQAAACDRIVVMDRGRIVEVGTHDELVAAGGRYGRLWEAWRTGQSRRA